MWLVHLLVSTTFAALFATFYWRLRRPLAGYVALLMLTHMTLAADVALFWKLATYHALVLLAIGAVLGASLTSTVVIVSAILSTLAGTKAPSQRRLVLSALIGVGFGLVTGWVVMSTTDPTSLVANLLVKPLQLVTSAWCVVLVVRVRLVATAQTQLQSLALQLLRVALSVSFVFTIVETLFRLRAGMNLDLAASTGVAMVSNLLGVLVLGLACLLCVIAHERVHVQTMLDRERALRQQLAEAEQLESLGLMASDVARDFDDVLTSVEQSIDGARRTWQQQPTDAVVQLGAIRDAADRGRHLTKHLMILARQQNDTPVVFKPSTAARDLVPSFVRSVAAIRQFDVSLAGSGEIAMSRTQFDQVLLNLLLNAHEASPEGEAVRLTVADHQLTGTVILSDGMCPAGNWVVVSVEDAGEPLDESQRLTLFHPKASSRRDAGADLGMRAVARAASSVGGVLNVQVGSSRGTRIEVWLPTLSSAARLESARAS